MELAHNRGFKEHELFADGKAIEWPVLDEHIGVDGIIAAADRRKATIRFSAGFRRAGTDGVAVTERVQRRTNRTTIELTSNAMRYLPTALGTLLLFLVGIYAVGCAPENDASSDVAVTDTAEAEVGADAAAEGSLQRPPRAADETRESPNAAASQTIGTTEITITYGRPAVKDREVFGSLEPYGEVWRAGANEATVFHTSGDVTINGEPLPAGVYGLFAVPDPDTWTLIFNRTAEQWGAFDYDEGTDALRVEATPESGAHKEWLDYSFEDLSDTAATAVLHWSTTRVPFTIAVAD